MFFPLYDNIRKHKSKKALSKDDKLELISNIKKLDQDGQHKVLAIILFYQIEKNLPQTEVHPTINVTLSTLPSELQVLLEIFCNLHLKSMQEMVDREVIPF